MVHQALGLPAVAAMPGLTQGINADQSLQHAQTWVRNIFCAHAANRCLVRQRNGQITPELYHQIRKEALDAIEADLLMFVG